MNTPLFELYTHSPTWFLLTAHQAACFWEHSPETAKWYINNGKDLDAVTASHAYDLAHTRLNMVVDINCNDLHPLVTTIKLTEDGTATVDDAINKVVMYQKSLDDA